MDEQQEKWQQELQDVEQKRYDLLPVHQRTQKRSQKVAKSCRTKKSNAKRTLVKCDGGSGADWRRNCRKRDSVPRTGTKISEEVHWMLL